MKVSGFTFIRNAIKYDYPVEEAIRSILPLCDDFIVAVGNSKDNTLKLIENIDPKIKIIQTVWDDTLREGGAVLARETDKAFQQVPDDSDWAFYIQGDEVLHEQYYDNILNSMRLWEEDNRVEGLVFDYQHFYGSYDYVGAALHWYRKEVRIIKNDKSIKSYKDAQGFRKNGKKLRVKSANATMYHYGWVRPPEIMQAKVKNFHQYWHSDSWIKENTKLESDQFDYSGVKALSLFKGSHPKVMQDRINKKNWKFNHDISFKKFTLKDKFKLLIERLFGFRPGEYKNYKLV